MKQGLPFTINKHKIQQKRCDGITNYAYYGPSFGINSRNLDIFLCADCNTNPASHAQGIGIKNSTIKDYEVFCLESQYIEMYKQYTQKLNQLIQQRKQEIQAKKLKFIPMPLPDGVKDQDIFSLSDSEDNQQPIQYNEQLDSILMEREKQIRNTMQ